jgi:hypothetical protein
VRCLLLIAACSNGTLFVPNDASVSDLAARDLAHNGRVPMNHRSDDSACAAAPPPGTCTLMGGFAECTSDGQCTMGTNGRCIQSTSGALTCRCAYDTCSGDTACATGQVCACHGAPYTNGAGNTCLHGNCRVDSDCPGSWCSPSASTTSCGGLDGYWCHTAGDLCTNDGDCPTQNGPQLCAFSTSHQRWECAPELLCP